MGAGGATVGSKPRLRGGRVRITPLPAGQLYAAAVGCHGGAGTTTLSKLIGVWDAGQQVPQPVDQARNLQMPILLVARGHADGIKHLQGMPEYVAGLGHGPIAVLIVGDGPWPEPRNVAARLTMIAKRGMTVVRIPFVPEWRYLDDPVEHAFRFGCPPQLARRITAVRTGLARATAV